MDTPNTVQLNEIEILRKDSQSEFQEKISHSILKNLDCNLTTKNFFIDEYDPIASQSAICIDEKISKNSIKGDNIIVKLFKNDLLMGFEEKINLAKIVFSYFTNFGTFEDFYEEECHLAMVNWIYKSKNFMETEKENPSQFYDLINIILNIFEILPIKAEDLFLLNIYEKLNKIRKIIKNKNFIIYQKLDRLLCYWSQFCSDNSMLNKKKERTDNNICEEMKEMEFPNRKKACLNKNSLCLARKIRDDNMLQTSLRSFYHKSSIYNSGILKTSRDGKKENKIRKSVKWEREEKINQINIFKYYDPPAAGAISQDEYESINSFLKEIRNRYVDVDN